MFLNNNSQPYLVRVTRDSKADKTVALISRLNLNFECWFLWEENQRKTVGAGTRTNIKVNPHVMPGLGIKPRPQQWEASALKLLFY